jgi:hypothetical protein
MTLVLRALSSAALCVALLGAACERPPPPAPPPRILTICERDAKPITGGDPAIAASFEAFSRGWIEKMKRVSVARGTARRTRIRDTYEMQLRRTGSAPTPYVGVLQYCEIGLSCASASESSCAEATSTVVTEMFRYQGGQWIH